MNYIKKWVQVEIGLKYMNHSKVDYYPNLLEMIEYLKDSNLKIINHNFQKWSLWNSNNVVIQCNKMSKEILMQVLILKKIKLIINYRI